MKIKFLLNSSLLFFFFNGIAFAQDVKQGMNHGDDHGQIFHAFTVEADVGEARDGGSKDSIFQVGLVVITTDYGSIVRRKITEITNKNLKLRHFTVAMLHNFGMHKSVFLMILAPTLPQII